MVDQAAELRNLMSQSSRRPDVPPGLRPAIVLLAGGKGGVGVTTLAVNMAMSLVDLGLRVVLVDADLYRADVATVCQLPERGHVGDILAARRDIHEVLERGPRGILVVPGIWSPDRDIPFSQHAQHRLVRQIQSLGRHADMVLIDVGSAAAEAVQRFWLAADEIVLVTTPDAVSVMDCYATLKSALAGGAVPDTVRLIVNKLQEAGQAEDVHQRIDQSARRFLQRTLGFLGSVVQDPQVAQATGLSGPLLLGRADGVAGPSIQAMAAALAASHVHAARAAA
ncbi:MAG: P-loop NTPase [Pirellulaceae bacterium]|jgi:flagellar biosynthesis protein FlhG|nr:P-loop NTPase [Pirellulaceae bacterium]